MKFVNILILFFVLVSGSLYSQDFQIVESVPVETVLEKSVLPRALDVWLEMINGAKKTIDIETFYFANKEGEVLVQVMDALIYAAERGVKIRIIVDKNFYKSSEKSVDDLKKYSNIKIRKIDFKKLPGGGGIMHSKYFVVDKETVFMGSQNMDWRALKHIHEMGIKVKNKKFARCFRNIFEMDWKLCAKKDEKTIKKLKSQYDVSINADNPLKLKSEQFGDVLLYPAISPPDLAPNGFSSEETELIKLIKNAKDRICIQVLTYSLKDGFDVIDSELRRAATRGVKSKIIFSNWSKREKLIKDIKNLSMVENIEIKFSNIPEFSGGYIPYSRVDHSKYMIVDNNISWISTANWEVSYFRSTRNTTVIITNSSVNQTLEDVFNLSWNSDITEKVEAAKDYKPPKTN